MRVEDVPKKEKHEQQARYARECARAKEKNQKSWDPKESAKAVQDICVRKRKSSRRVCARAEAAAMRSQNVRHAMPPRAIWCVIGLRRIFAHARL